MAKDAVPVAAATEEATPAVAAANASGGCAAGGDRLAPPPPRRRPRHSGANSLESGMIKYIPGSCLSFPRGERKCCTAQMGLNGGRWGNDKDTLHQRRL